MDLIFLMNIYRKFGSFRIYDMSVFYSDYGKIQFGIRNSIIDFVPWWYRNIVRQNQINYFGITVNIWTNLQNNQCDPI